MFPFMLKELDIRSSSGGLNICEFEIEATGFKRKLKFIVTDWKIEAMPHFEVFEDKFVEH